MSSSETTTDHDTPGSAASAAAPAIVAMRPEHGPQVLAIYQAGMDTGNATFETAAPSWTDFDQRHLPEHRVVALAPGGQVAGWVAAAPVSGRCVYAGVIEHSIYVHPDHTGQSRPDRRSRPGQHPVRRPDRPGHRDRQRPVRRPGHRQRPVRPAVR